MGVPYEILVKNCNKYKLLSGTNKEQIEVRECLCSLGENGVLRGIFKPKMDEVIGEERTTH